MTTIIKFHSNTYIVHSLGAGSHILKVKPIGTLQAWLVSPPIELPKRQLVQGVINIS